MRGERTFGCIRAVLLELKILAETLQLPTLVKDKRGQHCHSYGSDNPGNGRNVPQETRNGYRSYKAHLEMESRRCCGRRLRRGR